MSLVESEPDAGAAKPRGDLKHRFQPGNNQNPAGRPKGSKNKLSEAFLADVAKAWEEQGMAVIQRVIDERPQDFLKVVANILPKDVNMRVTQLDEMSDEQLLNKLKALTELARPMLARVIGPPVPEPVDVEYVDNTKG